MVMKIRHLCIIFNIVAIYGCYGNKTVAPKETTDSIQENNEDSSTSAIADTNDEERDYYDWTLEGYKENIPDEWGVVYNVLNLQQKADEVQGIDFKKIDKQVREYIAKNEIRLPKDTYQQIKKIEEICSEDFDIYGYDDTNSGMCTANMASLAFEDYILWMLENEAIKIKGSGINIKEEERMFKPLMDAFYNCCDSIGYDFGGSGGWMGTSEVYRIGTRFKKAMYESMLKPESPKAELTLIPIEQFEKECKNRGEDHISRWNYDPKDKTLKHCLTEYIKSMRNWLKYRSKAEKRISSPILRNAYSYQTRSFVREQYEHLKHNFERIGS